MGGFVITICEFNDLELRFGFGVNGGWSVGVVPKMHSMTSCGLTSWEVTCAWEDP